jgi:phosphoribosylformimino-5-aminoimidazole carboxamide ribotide isomerase
VIVIPAIDLREGRCVRLLQGDFARATVYSDDPIEMAQRWASAGARWLHVVDLDGARLGQPVQHELIERVIRAVPDVAVQVGGGVRTLDAVERLLVGGAARVVIGTAALERPDMLREALARFGVERVVVAVDSRDGWVATHGWETVQAIRVEEVVHRVVLLGVRRVLATDVTRDGTLTRPNLELMGRLAALGVTVIASGGVGSRSDLEALARVPGVEAAIVGRALYEGRVRFERPEDWVIGAEAA